MLQPGPELSRTPFYRKIHGSVENIFFFLSAASPPEHLEC